MEGDSVDYLNDFLDKSLVQKLKENKIEQLFAVQKVIIPLLTNQLKQLNLTKPHDLCVSSPTGSGKTYTFCLPIIEYLSKFSNKKLRALIILPVTDLASQVFKVLQELCVDRQITVASAIGNRPLEVDLETIFYSNTKENVLQNKADILVATPGKLMELISNVSEFSLKTVQILVIDEVDRILNSELEHDWIDCLDMSLHEDRNRLIDCDCSIKQNRKQKYSQFNGCCLDHYSSSRTIIKLLFSATLNTEKSKLDILNLFEPIFFNFSTQSTLEKATSRFELPKTLTQRYINVQTDYKPAMMVYLMRVLNYRKMICFVGSKENAHRLKMLLSKYEEFNVYELSSQIDAEQRNKLKEDFLQGKIDLIICTDILARGIDIQDVHFVINYEPPHNAQAYVHRSGRTARAGKLGTAITLVDSSEKQRFSVIARKTVGNRKLTNFKLNYDSKKFKEITESYVKLLESLKVDVMAESRKKRKQRLKAVKNLK